MKRIQAQLPRRAMFIGLALLLITAPSLMSSNGVVKAQELHEVIEVTEKQERPFDFSDEFYLANGVSIEKMINRRTGEDGFSTFDVTNDPSRTNVRVTQTVPAYDNVGGMVYRNVFGELFLGAFTPDAVGEKAKAVANSSPLFVFPRRKGDPLQLDNNRQADLVDIRDGYFSSNVLGLRVIVFVNFTDKALNTIEGQKVMADLIKRNGRNFDGTAIIKTRADIDNLTEKGFLTQSTRALDGSQGPAWVVFPVLKDPRGAIARDAFLTFVRQANGTPLPAEVNFVKQFGCLKDLGDWCN